MSKPQPPSRLTTDLLLQAYRIGYFPMAEDRFAKEVFWVRPDIRGVIPLKGFHLPKSLRKVVRQDRFEVRLNTAFREVMRGCAAPRTNREQTWINGQILDVYDRLHLQGNAHSIESWRDGQLVGGLYGVSIGGAFFGESMFSTETDASKVALVHLVGRLLAGGFRLLDAQFQNDHLTQFGAQEIVAKEYQHMLNEALAVKGDMTALPAQIRGSTILQSITQTS
ncbi:leucyl/phenylalanyl-tRNA-protein transferase [Parvularcula bermudensis HTCC2503]|uniref:Leucyl/phenylalanyl-tRNA--protein transferase n=1 Tax=Parvularcula bermudensis (strain ATCC BAA-594 / HTCC2503 / KCTC 12087) TaxID=314260 RepID=E0THW2_PARBH|nr:leucyl/phenylalanyl-tRNA--protein transferase [Parvularcula bermudensis]ADM10255.1 leucyl/phenylalanyl-tRNA-protein transferase [Parvularcula bermudensis HTCC2503]